MFVSVPLTILTVVLCVLGAFAVIYGIFRKFSQMGWAAWQILFAWCITMTLDWLPAEVSPTFRITMSVCIYVGAVVGTLVLGGVIRRAVLGKKTPAHPAWRFFNRLLGAITAVLDFLMIAVVPSVLALSFIYFVITPFEGLAPLFEMGIWTNFIGKFGLDLVLVAILFFSLRTGWQVGFGRTCVIFLMMIFTVGLLVLSLFLAIFVPPFSAMSTSIGASFSGMDRGVATILGYVFGFLILFTVLFVLLCIGGYFLVKLVRAIRGSGFFGFWDGLLGMVLAFAIAAACLFGFYFVCAFLTDGELFEGILSALHNLNAEQFGTAVIEGMVEQVMQYTQGLGTWLSSSPVSRGLFMLCGGA